MHGIPNYMHVYTLQKHRGISTFGAFISCCCLASRVSKSKSNVYTILTVRVSTL